MAISKPKVIMPFRDEEFEDDDQLENELDLTVSSKDFEDIIVAPADWTISSLVGLIGKQIKLDPEFQRRGVWSENAKIRFIESLFLNIPIPQILLAPRKEDKNSFIILDGKQRLLTIQEFWDGKFDSGKRFALKGLRLVKEIEGKDWSQIRKDPKWENRLINQTLRAAILKAWKKEDVLYEIFHRLNSGSVGLSPMELRTSLHRGEFLRSIIQWTEIPGKLHELLRLKRPDRRMSDAELVLRYIAFSEQEIEYDGDLKDFLDKTTKKFNSSYETKRTRDRIESRLATMNDAVSAAMEIFGAQNVCRKWKDGDYESRFNRAVFDIVIGSLSESSLRIWALKNKSKFKKTFIECCRSDREFLASLETSTKNMAQVRKRFGTWYKAISKVSDISLHLPKLAPVK